VPFVCIQIIMVAIIIIFPNIVSYGDPAEKARMEQSGDGSDLESLMQQPGMSGSTGQQEPNELLKQLQQADK
jgi:hypothetical protein